MLVDETVSQALGIQAGGPVMKRTRTGFDREGRTLEYTVGWYDGSRYSTTIITEAREEEQ